MSIISLQLKASDTYERRQECENDSFLKELVEEVDVQQEQKQSKYELFEIPGIFEVAEKIVPFMQNALAEANWQRDVWSRLLQRTTDINDGIPIDWERRVNFLILETPIRI